MDKDIVNDWDVTEEEEYKRVPRLKLTDVDAIMEWATKQPHLPKFQRHRGILFLRACDYSLEKTKETIETYFTLRTRYAELLGTMDFFSPASQKAIMKLDQGIMPSKDSQEAFYIYHKPHSSPANEWNANEIARLALMAFEISHLTMGSGSGYHVVVDMKDLKVPQLITTPISTVQVMLKFLQEASHYKLKSIQFLNGGSVMDKVLSMLKPFLNKEVRDLINMHSSWESLVDTFDVEFVPRDYGGTGPSMQEIHAKTCELFEKKNEWFKEDSKLKIDQSKRPTESKHLSDEIKGSFRKLDID